MSGSRHGQTSQWCQVCVLGYTNLAKCTLCCGRSSGHMTHLLPRYFISSCQHVRSIVDEDGTPPRTRTRSSHLACHSGWLHFTCPPCHHAHPPMHDIALTLSRSIHLCVKRGDILVLWLRQDTSKEFGMEGQRSDVAFAGAGGWVAWCTRWHALLSA